VVTLQLGFNWFPDDAGGAPRYFHDLLEGLRASGVAVPAVAVGPAAAPPAGVVVPVRADDPLPRRLLGYARAANRLGRTADLVDSHFSLYSFLPVVLGRLRRKPLVVHFHGPWADESVADGETSRPATVAKRAVERAVYRRAAAVVTLSAAFKRILVERDGIDPWRVHVIPPGVDLDRFSPGDRHRARARLGLDDDVWIACSVRRLVPRMGLDVLLRAWAELRSEGLLLLAGEGPERQELEALATRLEIEGSVRFLGRVSEEMLVDLYRAADVCVVPSTTLEGFGLVVLEALACGTPVTASDVGGLPSALAGLEPRLIVPAGDPRALAARLRSPLPERAACRAAAERFSWGRCVERHRDLYRQVMRGGEPRKLRVVYLNHTSALSLPDLALVRLLPAFEDVEPHVILREDGPLVGRLLEAGVSVEVLAPGPRGPRSYVVELARRLRRLCPDVVHTSSVEALSYGGPAAELVRVPIVTEVLPRLDGYSDPPSDLHTGAQERANGHAPAVFVAEMREVYAEALSERAVT
jgi:glycosyltransferase involved in cell wall biosynthesis